MSFFSRIKREKRVATASVTAQSAPGTTPVPPFEEVLQANPLARQEEVPEAPPAEPVARQEAPAPPAIPSALGATTAALGPDPASAENASQPTVEARDPAPIEQAALPTIRREDIEASLPPPPERKTFHRKIRRVRPRRAATARKPIRTKKAKPMANKRAKKPITNQATPKRNPAKAKVNSIVNVAVVEKTMRPKANPPPEPALNQTASPSTEIGFPAKLDDSRQAFVVLAWFEYLLKRIPVRELPYLIDQYRKIGWIDDTLHAWFIKMAQGVGAVRSKAGETQFARQNARGLVTLHKETLRFLKQLRSAGPPVANHDNGVLVGQPIVRKR